MARYLVPRVDVCALLGEPGVEGVVGLARDGGVVEGGPALQVLPTQTALPSLQNREVGSHLSVCCHQNVRINFLNFLNAAFVSTGLL